MEEEIYLIEHIDGGYLYRAQSTKWERVSQKERATHLTYEKAENVINNSISSDERKFWQIVADEQQTKAISNNITNEKLSFDWNILSQTQQELFVNLKRYREELRDNLSQVDREICDIQHYIEFFSLDAAKGYKAYRMLKERLVHRRFIKEEMTKVNCFLAGNAQKFASGAISKQMKVIDHHIYTPRILNELFGGNIVNGKTA